MANRYNSKVVVDGEVLIDLTNDTVTADKLSRGVTAHDKSGAVISGTNTYDADTSDGTVSAGEVLYGEVCYSGGSRIVGTMPNKGTVSGEIATVTDEFAIPAGCHDGSGRVRIKATEKQKIIASNIKSGISILGVTGAYGGETAKVQANKDVLPSFEEQIITSDVGYDYISQVTVKAISINRMDNAAGGVTVTIGA